jgi:hypothetical protein
LYQAPNQEQALAAASASTVIHLRRQKIQTVERGDNFAAGKQFLQISQLAH